MPFPVAAIAIGAVARGALGVAARGAARGATAAVARGAVTRGAAGLAARGIANNLSSSQFGSTEPVMQNPGTAITEPLRFGADMRVGTER